MKQPWVIKPAAQLCALISIAVLSGCNDKSTASSAKPAIPEVKVATIRAQKISISAELPGRTSAFRVAEVRPQVSGIILKRAFIEGSDVKAGEVLYQIDPAPYRAELNSAKGALAQAKATANIAAVTVRRYRPLIKDHLVSQQDFDQSVATAEQTLAAVQTAQAAVESAQINLDYSSIKAPVSGRIGRSSFTEGALVQNAQSTAMATIQQLDPLYVDVTESSQSYMNLQQQMAQGKVVQMGGKAQVTLLLADGSSYAHKGTLEFSDVTVDQTTGSITLRAVIPNPQHQLLPGMFVRAKLDEGEDPHALLVPQQAITRDPRGNATTLVVGTNNKVSLRSVTTAQAMGDQWRVTSGLQAGERVIVLGIQRAQPGQTVNPAEATPASQSSTNAADPTS